MSIVSTTAGSTTADGPDLRVTLRDRHQPRVTAGDKRWKVQYSARAPLSESIDETGQTTPAETTETSA
jgi:hypothetical protein